MSLTLTPILNLLNNKVGDRVMGMGPAIPVQFWGTYAEYIVLAEKHITKVNCDYSVRKF